MHNQRSDALHYKRIVALALIAITAAVFGGLAHYDFIHFDDMGYLRDNVRVRSGLSWSNIGWAFASTEEYWIPVTRLLRMALCHVFGLEAGWHHAANVALHASNAVLLFLLLLWMTGAWWRSALVAALFAVHPLRVESVAWVTELKDVLSTMFWILAIWAYAAYARARSIALYGLMLALFCLGLMSKPMVVTFPAILLVLDYWPLGRSKQESWAKLFTEKLPLFAVSALYTGVTLLMVRVNAHVSLTEGIPWIFRTGNGLIAYVGYIQKTLWPSGLSIFYPFAVADVTWMRVGLSMALLGLISLLVFLRRRESSYGICGWLWFLLALLPVIWFAHERSCSMADRFTYVPQIGLLLMMVWGAHEIAERWRVSRTVRILAASACLVALMVTAHTQTRYWRNTFTLFGRALDLEPDNWQAHHVLAVAYAENDMNERAVHHYQEELRLFPDEAPPRVYIANIFVNEGRWEEAIGMYLEALRRNPKHGPAYVGLGVVLAKQGNWTEAMEYFAKAVQTRTGRADGHNHWGNALALQGKIGEAYQHYVQALQADADHADAHYNIGNIMIQQGRNAEAAATFERAAVLAPRDADVRNNWGIALAHQGKVQEAIGQFRLALQLSPGHVQARKNIEYYHGQVIASAAKQSLDDHGFDGPLDKRASN